jgi:nucleoside-diphosphate-sugar epimerase
MKKIILITGASGFIGSVLLRNLFKQNYEIHLILRDQSHTWRINDLLKKVMVHHSNLSNLEELKKIIKISKPDIIYHLATNGAYSYQKDANQIIETNILGTWNLIQACNEIDYKLFVNTGSSSEYGFKSFAMRETDILEPASYYAVTKSAQTLLCSHIARQEKRPIVTIRPFSVYGPYEEPKRLFPTLMKSLLLGEEMNLVSPDTARDQIYVDDVVEAYLKIEEMTNNPGEYFNVGSGTQSTIREVVETAVEVTGKTTKFNWGNMESRTWDTNAWVADISKARRLLNWNPKNNLKEGIQKTWNWFKNNSQFYC